MPTRRQSSARFPRKSGSDAQGSSVRAARPEKLPPAAARFVREIEARIDRRMIRKVVNLSRRLNAVLSAASPRSTKDLISGVAVDLSDLWEVGQEHERRIAKLLKMRFPRDKARLEDMLYDFEIRLIYHAEWHLRHLKKRLAQLRRDLRKKPSRSSQSHIRNRANQRGRHSTARNS